MGTLLNMFGLLGLLKEKCEGWDCSRGACPFCRHRERLRRGPAAYVAHEASR